MEFLFVVDYDCPQVKCSKFEYLVYVYNTLFNISKGMSKIRIGVQYGQYVTDV